MDTNKNLIIGKNKYRILFSQKQIANKVNELAKKIATKYQNEGNPPILIYVLNGAMVFGVHLSESLDALGLVHQIDTVGLGRYNLKEQGGDIKLFSQPRADLSNRDLIVIEDVIDEGCTMNFLNDYLKACQPKSITFCALGLKAHHKLLNFSVRYIGFNQLGPEWLVGYGMDSEGCYRSLSDIYIKID